MIKLARACRLAAAAFAMVPFMTAAHATETTAASSIGGALVAPPASMGGRPETPNAIAPNNAAPKTASLNELVSSFVGGTNADEETTCLAKAVYFEARGESLEGQLAVAKVVLNRVGSGIYPPSICGVVTQRAQFSFIHRGRFPQADESSDSWRTAVAIADIARNNLARSVAADVMWYHASYVSPSWERWHVVAVRIGNHIFYS